MPMSTRLRSVGALLTAAAVTVASSACSALSSPGSNSPAGKVTIAVAGLSNLHNVPLVLADKLGYFKAAGVDVQLQDLQAGSRALSALMAGSVQAAASFYDHTLEMQAKHQDLVSFITLSRSPGAVLVVPPKHAAAIKNVAGLAGHPIGVSAPGSAEDQYMSVAFHRAGIGPGDVSKMSIGTGTSAVAALEKGSVYGAWLFEPAYSQFAARNPGSKALVDTRTAGGMKTLFGNGGYAAETLYAKPSWLKSNAKDARAVDKAVVRALGWMSRHSAKEIAAKIPGDLRGKDLATYVKVLGGTLPIFTKDGAMPAGGYTGNVELLRLSEGLKNLRPTKTFTNDYLPGKTS